MHFLWSCFSYFPLFSSHQLYAPSFSSHNFQCGLFSFHPQPYIPFCLWLTVQNCLPSTEQQFSMLGELLTGLCQQSAQIEQRGDCESRICTRERDRHCMEHPAPLQLRAAAWVAIPRVQVNLRLNWTCFPVPAFKSRTHSTQQTAQLEQAIYSHTWSSDKIMDML